MNHHTVETCNNVRWINIVSAVIQTNDEEDHPDWNKAHLHLCDVGINAEVYTVISEQCAA